MNRQIFKVEIGYRLAEDNGKGSPQWGPSQYENRDVLAVSRDKAETQVIADIKCEMFPEHLVRVFSHKAEPRRWVLT